MRVEEIPLALSYNDVLLVPRYSTIQSRTEVDLTTTISPRLTLKLPLLTTKMDTVTGVEMAIKIGQLGGMGIIPRFDGPELQAEKVSQVAKAGVVTAAAVGVKDDYLKRAELLVKAGATVIDIDVAHGHMQKTIDATKAVHEKFGDAITLLSGITSTYECAKDLYESGADCVLVGVGAGSICTTRVQTGFGVPSMTALWDTAKAAKECGKTFMPDAGIETSGDIVKALATGACAICAGYIFAGTDECPGDIVEINDNFYKRYNGSASYEEKLKQISKYAKDKHEKYAVHIEGVSGLVPYRGPVEHVIDRLVAGIKSGLSYAGARNLKELVENAQFIRVTPAGQKENGAHGVLVQN